MSREVETRITMVEHDNLVREELLDDLRKIVVELYDDGFRDPLVTFNAAVSKMRYGDLKIRKER